MHVKYNDNDSTEIVTRLSKRIPDGRFYFRRSDCSSSDTITATNLQ